MDFPVIAAQLDFLSWRDTQLRAISQQLEDAFPDLVTELSKKVEEASVLDLAWSTVSVGSSTESLIQRWGADQLEIAMLRAEAELTESLDQIPGGMNLNGDLWQNLNTALPAMAGVGLIAASVAAIPTVVSFATVSTSVLAIFSTAAISLPLLAVGTAGVAIAALLGSQSLKYAETNIRSSLTQRLQTEVGRRVFGIGEKAGALCMLSDIQAVVVKAGQNRIRGAVS